MASFYGTAGGFGARPYTNRMYTGGPTGLSYLNLFRPNFLTNNIPSGPGGGFLAPQPFGAVTRLTAPTFQAATYGGTGVKGASSVAAGGSVGNAGPGGQGGFGGDPAVAKARAYADMVSQQAREQALAAMKQDLIRFGDPDLVPRVLGGRISTYHKGPMAGQDKGRPYRFGDVQKAAAGNTFSTTKELGRWNDRSNAGINEQRNSQNLFYSSARARDLAMQGEDYLRQKTAAANSLQDAIAAIQAQLQQALLNARGIVMQAEGASAQNQASGGGGGF
jgi:hypothetical protein